MENFSSSDRDFFEKNGVVVLRNILAPEYINLLNIAFSKNIANPSAYACFYTALGAPGLFRDDYCKLAAHRRVSESNI